MLENGNRLRRIGGGGCGGRLQGRRRLLSVCSSSSRHAAPMINPTDDVLAPTARTPNTIGQSFADRPHRKRADFMGDYFREEAFHIKCSTETSCAIGLF